MAIYSGCTNHILSLTHIQALTHREHTQRVVQSPVSMGGIVLGNGVSVSDNSPVNYLGIWGWRTTTIEWSAKEGRDPCYSISEHGPVQSNHQPAVFYRTNNDQSGVLGNGRDIPIGCPIMDNVLQDKWNFDQGLWLWLRFGGPVSV